MDIDCPVPPSRSRGKDDDEEEEALFAWESKTRTLRAMPSVSCIDINLICKSIESDANILLRGVYKQARE